MADLIQHGHMTPFGGQIIDGVSHGGKGVELTGNSTTPSNSTTENSNETPCDDTSIPDNSNLLNTHANSEIHDEIEIIHDEAVRTDAKGGVDDGISDDIPNSGSDEAFVPDDDLYYSSSGSYVTDDEDDIRGQSTRVKRYRDINSSESDDERIHTNRIKKVKSRTPLSQRRLHSTLTVDDGDDYYYKMRIK